MDIKTEILKIVGEKGLKINEPMKEHITFEVGGPADYYVQPESKEDLIDLIKFIKSENIPYYIIGNGSNLIIKDKGYRGVIIDLTKLNQIKVNNNIITAQTGAKLKDVAEISAQNGLSGYEFASGIPGTIGGAVRMNAGAYDGEHKYVVDSIEVIDEENKLKTLDNKDCHFSYRHSIIQEKPYIVTEVNLKLTPDDKEKIRNKIDDLNRRRKEKQPLEYPSAGSTFKRPKNNFAGTLIDKCGLKGKRVGGAMVSTKHAGFVINYDQASAEDILNLIETVQKEVKRQAGVDIQPEVIVIGE